MLRFLQLSQKSLNQNALPMCLSPAVTCQIMLIILLMLTGSLVSAKSDQAELLQGAF